MIVKENFNYTIDGDDFQGVICYDNEIKDPLPGVLVSHQYSGCSKLEERKAEFLAKEGYFAFAIDLYGKGIRGNTPEESLELMRNSDIEQINESKLFVKFYCYEKLIEEDT